MNLSYFMNSILELNSCTMVNKDLILVSQSKAWPASLRLMDNKQFQFGMALKTEDKNKFQ